MLIGIDGNEANIKERVGVNVWAWEILKKLSERLPRAAKGSSRNDISVQVYLSNLPMEDLPKETENWKYRVIGPGKFWTRCRLPFDLYFHKPRPDVLFIFVALWAEVVSGSADCLYYGLIVFKISGSV